MNVWISGCLQHNAESSTPHTPDPHTQLKLSPPRPHTPTEQPEANAGLRPVVAGVLERTGFYEDLPFEEAPTAAPGKLSAEEAETVAAPAFDAYAARLTSYLGVLEARLFSEGLHVLGESPTEPALLQYLDAYFDGQLPRPVLEAVAALDTPDDTEPRVLLSRLLAALRAAAPGVAEALGDVLSEPLGGGGGGGYNWYESLSSEEKYEMELWPLDLLRFYGACRWVGGDGVGWVDVYVVWMLCIYPARHITPYVSHPRP